MSPSFYVIDVPELHAAFILKKAKYYLPFAENIHVTYCSCSDIPDVCTSIVFVHGLQ
jgi:hypothetical protein